MARTRRNWTLAEDELLRTAVKNASAQNRPLLWRELAKSVPGRSNKDCRRRWWNSLADGPAKGPWSENEDERLIEAVQKHGTNWSQVSLAVGSRNSDQCLSHWNHVLDPDINHRDWTAKEDELLLHAVLSNGTNWTTIASMHPQKRTTLALKNRYSALRLRNENSKKAHNNTCGRMLKSPPATEDSPRTTRSQEQGSNQKTPDMGHWDFRGGVNAEEEDENEYGWDDEDVGGEDDDEDYAPPDLSRIPDRRVEANRGFVAPPDTQMRDRSGPSPPPEPVINFGTGTSNDYGLICPDTSHHDLAHLCTGGWMNDTSYLTPCESTYFDHNSLGLPSEFNENSPMQSRGSMNMSEDIMDCGLVEYNPVPKPIAGLPACGDNTIETERGYSNSPTSFSSLSKDGHNTQGPGHALPTYEVNVYVECTVTELEKLMAGLATTGTPYTVNMKPKKL
ncbi:uncharacterized protein RAG0_16107 [Rhynchosporium agropyri]|uniref:Uncharacterized protein n=1 Tax=Rhynchosporium agropyri TaxID=914238 RepID=A0A1E1LNV5_9HELO|nr:uncharacterized protein RAG0_16107 [Rhynchosporium agropyri]